MGRMNLDRSSGNKWKKLNLMKSSIRENKRANKRAKGSREQNVQHQGFIRWSSSTGPI